MSKKIFDIIVLLYYSFITFEVYSLECNPHNVTHLSHAWKRYKEHFNKTYGGLLEKRRRKAWIENCYHIHKHNKEYEEGLHSYSLRANQLADLTQNGYLKEMVRLIKSRRRKLLNDENEMVALRHYDGEEIPREVDWRAKGFITPPNNQKDCGSCYAFSISQIIEAQVFKQTGQVVPLSAQQIVDCSTSTGNHGCGGGSLRIALKYLEKAGGLTTDKDYPYVARTTKCKFDENRAVVNITNWAILPARDEKALEVAVATIGPVAVSINASPRTFQLYHQGIYDDIECSSNTVNHAMIAVGYTKDEWILKNWWGDHWGEKGYMRLKRHKNRCGVANYAAYVLV